MLYGRHEERRVIHALLAAAGDGYSGVLVIRGEAGVGKHALLQDAASQATDFRLLRGTGVESEIELAFAALHQLLRPVLGWLDRLPEPQANALRGAFGLIDTQPTNPFLIELGVLSLLSEVAKERPVLCLVDDAQRLDRASADALVFAARRLGAEPIVLLLAARDDGVRQFDAPDLPSLRLEGLDPEEAGQLLEAQAGKLAPEVRDRLIEETGGNPLALLELPASLSGEQLAGREPLPERLPLSDRLQQTFLERVRRLPEAARTLLLVAAAEDGGELATVLAAGRVLAAGPQALEPAERSGLIQVSGPRLEFRHPLVRSAIYQGATFIARQAAHRALAEVLQGEQHADRRTWHLAAATLGSDEEVARALEASANRARRRGSPAAAAAALERAAALTPAAGPWAWRLVAAAESLWEAGRGDRALSLLDRVEPHSTDPAVRARMVYVRGAVELASGTPAIACTLLVDGARLILQSDPGRATEMLVLATWAALAANEPRRIVEEISPAVPRLPGHDDVRVQRVADSLLAARIPAAAPAAVTEEMLPTPATTWPHPSLVWLWPMLVVVEPAGNDVAADQQYAKLVAAGRAAGAIRTPTVALANLAIAEVSLGLWPSAVGNATEGLRLARETGQQAMTGYFSALLASIAAQQGRAEDCRRLAEAALAVAAARRLAVVAAFASWALAQLDLADGRPAAALERLLALATPHDPTAYAPIALLTTGDLVEAAARAGRLEGMEPFLARFERWAAWDKRTWASATAARCRALLTPGEAAGRYYQTALTVDGVALRPFELARTELLYGEWLRRARRRADARPHLRAALEAFHRLGAIPWTERARVELRASGETARKRDPSTLKQLTPQELRIARLAAEGLTNREIAAGLFLSPHTISYHLHKIYAKLEVASRVDLRHLDLDDGDER
jgi:DNA-binding CsgD family transcriptional regulator